MTIERRYFYCRRLRLDIDDAEQARTLIPCLQAAFFTPQENSGARGLASFRLQHPPGRSRMLRQHGRRPNRAANEFAAAVRADPMQPVLDAVGAERALIGADPRLQAVRRQILVAALAVGTQFEHYSAATATAAGPSRIKPSY